MTCRHRGEEASMGRSCSAISHRQTRERKVGEMSQGSGTVTNARRLTRTGKGRREGGPLWSGGSCCDWAGMTAILLSRSPSSTFRPAWFIMNISALSPILSTSPVHSLGSLASFVVVVHRLLCSVDFHFLRHRHLCCPDETAIGRASAVQMEHE